MKRDDMLRKETQRYNLVTQPWRGQPTNMGAAFNRRSSRPLWKGWSCGENTGDANACQKPASLRFMSCGIFAEFGETLLLHKRSQLVL